VRVSPATQAQWIFIRLLGPRYDLVIYVCEVTHILYIIPQVLHVAVQNIKGDVHPGMSYVSPATQNHMFSIFVFRLYFTVWGVEPDVTHQTSWLESTDVHQCHSTECKSDT